MLLLDLLIMLLNFILHLTHLTCKKQCFRRLDLASFFSKTRPLLNEFCIKSAQWNRKYCRNNYHKYMTLGRLPFKNPTRHGKKVCYYSISLCCILFTYLHNCLDYWLICLFSFLIVLVSNPELCSCWVSALELHS